jgi:hypothetical protein
MRATDAFAKEVEKLYKPFDAFDDDAANNGAGAWEDDADSAGPPNKRARKQQPVTAAAFSLLRAAALMTAALDEPQLSFDEGVLPALAAAERAANRRLLARPTNSLSLLRRSSRPDTERLEKIATAVAAALRLDAGLIENVQDAFDPRNFALDRDVLRALRGASADDALTAANSTATPTGPAIAAILFAELARRLRAGVALAGTQDRPLLRLFDRDAAESAPTSADVAAGEGEASAWAETTTTTDAAATTTPVVPPPSVLVDPVAALWPQEGDYDDDNDAFLKPEEHAFLFAWWPHGSAWVPTAALDRPETHPDEPPRAWNTLDPSSAPPLATRALLHAALAATKRTHAASGRFDDALAACRLARRVDPLDLDELRDEGALLVGVKRWAEGARTLREYLTVAPGGPPDREWVEAEAARAWAMSELEALRARRALEAEKAEEGE